MTRARLAFLPAMILLAVGTVGASQADARGFGRGGSHGGGVHGGGTHGGFHGGGHHRGDGFSAGRWGSPRPMIMSGLRRPSGIESPVFDNLMPTVCMRQRWAFDAWGNPYRTYSCR